MCQPPARNSLTRLSNKPYSPFPFEEKWGGDIQLWPPWRPAYSPSDKWYPSDSSNSFQVAPGKSDPQLILQTKCGCFQQFLSWVFVGTPYATLTTDVCLAFTWTFPAYAGIPGPGCMQAHRGGLCILILWAFLRSFAYMRLRLFYTILRFSQVSGHV